MVGGWKTRSLSACSSLCKALVLARDGFGGEVWAEFDGGVFALADGINGRSDGVQVGESWSLLAVVVKGKASDGLKNQDATDAH